MSLNNPKETSEIRPNITFRLIVVENESLIFALLIPYSFTIANPVSWNNLLILRSVKNLR